MFCGHCGKTIGDGLTFCPFCGKAQVDAPAAAAARAAESSAPVPPLAPGVCPSCGYQNGPKRSTCKQCRAKLPAVPHPARTASPVAKVGCIVFVLVVAGLFVIGGIGANRTGSSASAPAATSAAVLPPAPSTVAVKAAAPAGVNAQPPITVSGVGTKNTEPFTLTAGNYRVAWTAKTQSGNNVGCFHSARLAPAGGTGGESVGSGGPRDKAGSQSDETILYRVAAGSYYVAAISGCEWSITLTSLAA